MKASDLRALERVEAELDAADGASPDNPPPAPPADRATRIARFLRDQHGEPVVWAPHHLAWFAHVEDAWSRGERAGILAPLGWGKTAFVIGLLLDEIALERNIRAQVVSKVVEIAGERVGSVKRYVEESAEYRETYAALGPVVPDRALWGTNRILVERTSRSPDPTLSAYGILTGGAGKRSDLTVFDDSEDIGSLSEAVRDATWDRLTNIWLKRLEQPSGRVVMIGTTYHEHDAASRLVRTPGWRWLVQGVAEDFSHLEQVVVPPREP